jgi:hypothetical protein
LQVLSCDLRISKTIQLITGRIIVDAKWSWTGSDACSIVKSRICRTVVTNVIT